MVVDMPALENLIQTLQWCRKQKNPTYAKLVCTHLYEEQLEAHSPIGNYLVPLLVECGSLPDAEHVFRALSHRNEHSWSSLILGHIHGGNHLHAFHLYHHMLEDGVPPNSYTFVALLSACANLKDAKRGRQVYIEIIKQGLDINRFVGNTLIEMFGRCGTLLDAQGVFDKVPNRDIVSWNALIARYAEHGFCEEAMSCFDQMRLEDVAPDVVTLVCGLKACGSVRCLKRGRELHAEIMKIGIERDVSVGNTLVDMYGKCSLLVEALHVFNFLPLRSAVSWNALVAGFADHGLGEEALGFFEQMHVEGIFPDNFTYVGTLKACCNVEEIRRGRAIYVKLIQNGLQNDLSVASTLIDLFSKCGSLVEARIVFDKMLVHDVVSWTALIAGYAEHGYAEEALSFLGKMQQQGVPLNSVTLTCGLKACACAGALDKGRQLHAEIIEKGLEIDLSIGNTLVDMFCKCASLEEAQGVFDSLPVKDGVSWAALVSGYAQHGSDEEVINCFDRMKGGCVSADAVTIVRCLKACSCIGASEKGQEVHAEIKKLGLERDLFVGNTLMDMYGKCGLVVEAQEVFDNMPVHDVVSWNVLLSAYGENHDGNGAIQCFHDMQEEGVTPDALTFSCLFVACSHASLVDKAQEYFKMMRESFSIEPTFDHYVCLVDLLARTGHIIEAEKFARAIERPLPTQIMTALLNACRKYGKVELGQRLFQQLVDSNPAYAATYSLTADMYANTGR